MKRIGHRYIDRESGKTLDSCFPRTNQHIGRSCLAEMAGIIRGDFTVLY